MSAAAQAVGSNDLATWLTWDVPAAIIGDTPIPPRPDGGKSGGSWLGKLFGA